MQVFSSTDPDATSTLIYRYSGSAASLKKTLSQYHPQIVDSQYAILEVPFSENVSTIDTAGYYSVPKLFTYLNTQSLETTGILSAQTNSVLSLSGKGVLVGFLDSGIDYRLPAFRDAAGKTRIRAIWDQTESSSSPPEGFLYGSEYSMDTINAALFSPDPASVVPERDENGHGTAVAGIACGSIDASSDFYGAAPQSEILFVKLRPARSYLRDYFILPPNAPAFQESDLMLGIRYLVQTSRRLRMPLVICISLGSNQGSHTGKSPLEEVLASLLFQSGNYVVTAAGNEAGQSHHFYGRLKEAGDSVSAEIVIDQKTNGFTLEFWSFVPDQFRIGFISPSGEVVEPFLPRTRSQQTFSFLLDSTKIIVDFEKIEPLSGSSVAMIRFLTPSPGLWRIRVESKTFFRGSFHMWLPITGLLDPRIKFFQSDPDTTLVIPSCSNDLIAVSTFNAYNNSLFLSSSRGYTREESIKPDFASPGVSVTAPTPLQEGNFSSGYTAFTGSSAASAMTSGAVALLVEWGLKRPIPRIFTAEELKNLFISSAGRSPGLYYPNREWGYGSMNLASPFG